MSKGLNSYRALAFFAVLLCHLRWFNLGYLGVQAFFVLSGFLLTPILLEMKSSLSGKSFFIHFYGRRILRIFPLYYLFLAGLTLIYFVFRLDYIPDMHYFYQQLPYTLSFSYNFYFATDYHGFTRICTHLWSLAVEEQFYLLWPMVIYFVPDKKIKATLILVIVLGPGWRLLTDYLVNNHWLNMLHERSDIIIYILPFSHFDAFAIGGFFALYRKKISAFSVWSIIILAITIAGLSELMAGEKDAGYYAEFTHYMSDSYQFVWGYSLANFVFATIILQVREKAFLSVIFENSLLCYLGTISYGLYIFHFPIQSFCLTVMQAQPKLLVDITILLLTVVISCLSYELMEKRMIAMKDRFFARNKE